MRCKCCDKPLNEYELLAMNPYTKEPEDMCRKCLNTIQVVDETFEDDIDVLWVEQNLLDKYEKS